MLRICLDLNVWCGAFISARLGRTDTAAFILTNAARSGASERGPLALVISWGMLARLRDVLVDPLSFSVADAERLTELIAAYAREGPSLTLGGVGVLPIHDAEDRHVLETAWAGAADLLVTHNLSDFVVPEAEALVPHQIYGLRRGSARLVVCHTYNAAAWLQGGDWPDPVARFLHSTT